MSPALSFNLGKAVQGDERVPLVKVGGVLLRNGGVFNKSDKSPCLFWGNLVAAVLHTGLAVATAALGDFKQRIPLFVVRNAAFLTGKDLMTFSPIVKAADLSLSPVWLTFFFCAITAFAHAVYVWYFTKYIVIVEQGTQLFRWVEYALSAPPMIILIAIAAGEREAITLATYALLTSLTMVCGAGGELVYKLKETENGSRRLFLLTGVSLQTYIWTLLLVKFVDTATTAERGPPTFVYGIVASEVVLFCSFAVVHICHTEFDTIAKNAEGAYIFLSFVSKAVLAILLLTFALRVSDFDDAVK